MNNIVKRIAAAAMAFTLLGAGSAATGIVAPQSGVTLTASAAAHSNKHNLFYKFVKKELVYSYSIVHFGENRVTVVKVYKNHYEIYCSQCRKVIGTAVRETKETEEVYL